MNIIKHIIWTDTWDERDVKMMSKEKDKPEILWSIRIAHPFIQK
jgi:hypothetical protein